MRTISQFILATTLGLLQCPALADEATSAITLRQAFVDDFLLGVALNRRQIDDSDTKSRDLAARQFSSLTPENELKWQSLHPQPGVYRFEGADDYADFALKSDMKLIGHTLVWHSQTPDWVFQGKDGQPKTRDELLDLMREHIHTVVGRYKGKVFGWDVVNEALSDRGTEILRDSPWRRIIGDDFLDHAFRFAHEADPAAELYYNDYGLEDPRKRENCVTLLKGLLERGVPINGVGTQSHFHINNPSTDEIEKTIKEFASLGLKVEISELDVDVLPSRGPTGNADISRREQGSDEMNPYSKEFPADMQEKLAKRYSDIFGVYVRNSQSIGRVTFWGLDDGNSWLNGFPVRGRTNHPLLIGRDLMPKPAFFAVLKTAN